MALKNHSSRILINIVAVLAFIVLAYFIFRSNKSPESGNTNTTVNPKDIIHTEIAAKDLPANSPRDLPFLNTGVVLQNYKTTTPEGHQQEVRRWVAESTRAEAKKAYSNYFEKNGWTITTSYENNTTTLLGAHKEAVTLSVSISPGQKPAQSIIELSVNSK